MTALLLYGYSRGIYSSRRLAMACEERVDFMAVTVRQCLNFRPISDCRKRHLAALSARFVQVLALCRRAGLARLGHVALDGTKVKAKASKHKAMSYGRMVKAQRNFTDPDSRILKTRDGFIQGYNAQTAADDDHQVIVAHRLTPEGRDQDRLAPMLCASEAMTGRQPDELPADAGGYCSEANIETLETHSIRGYLATGRQKHGTTAVGSKAAAAGSRRATMARRLKRGGRRSRYRLRKITIEPVFGQIKQARSFRKFLLRGLNPASHKWALICIPNNLNKLARARA